MNVTLDSKKNSLVQLGQFLGQFTEAGFLEKSHVPHNDLFFEACAALIPLSQSHNGWFTQEEVLFAIASWSEALRKENLNKWLAPYSLNPDKPLTIALILAGNVPLVGFHDFISVLLSGHKALVKLSSNDQKLLPFLAQYLIAVEPGLRDYIQFTEGKLENFDAVIATGSNNTARYFEYYFKDKPAIIRKNRNSVAILDGNESAADIHALGTDIFRYFGLGCRNVSKLFVPEGYDFKTFFEGIFGHSDIIHYEKYANNYDYNKAVFLMSNYKLLDNGFITLKEDTSYASPISSIFYEFYNDEKALANRLENDADQLQCIVGNKDFCSVPFGETQKPALWDYADNVDTIAFLQNLNTEL